MRYLGNEMDDQNGFAADLFHELRGVVECMKKYKKQDKESVKIEEVEERLGEHVDALDEILKFPDNVLAKKGKKSSKYEQFLEEFMEKRSFDKSFDNFWKDMKAVSAVLIESTEQHPCRNFLKLIRLLCKLVLVFLDMMHGKIEEEETSDDVKIDLRDRSKPYMPALPVAVNLNEVFTFLSNYKPDVTSDIKMAEVEDTHTHLIRLFVYIYENDLPKKMDMMAMPLPVLLSKFVQSLEEKRSKKYIQTLVGHLCACRTAIDLFNYSEPSFEHIARLYISCLGHSDHGNALLETPNGIKFLSRFFFRMLLLEARGDETGRKFALLVHQRVVHEIKDLDAKSKKSSAVCINAFAMVYIDTYARFHSLAIEEEDPELNRNFVEYLEHFTELAITLIDDSLRKKFVSFLECIHQAAIDKSNTELGPVVQNLIQDMYEGSLFVYLSCVNSKARLKAMEVFELAFPISPTNKPLLNVQVKSMVELLADQVPKVRCQALQMSFRLLQTWKDVFQKENMRSILSAMMDMRFDTYNQSAITFFEGLEGMIKAAQDNLELHGLVKKLLKNVAAVDALSDTSPKVRKSFISILLLLQHAPYLKFDEFITEQSILSQLAAEGPKNSKLCVPLTEILLASFFPKKADKKEKLKRYISLCDNNQVAAIFFFKTLPSLASISAKGTAQTVSVLASFLKHCVKTEGEYTFDRVRVLLISISHMWCHLKKSKLRAAKDVYEKLKEKLSFDSFIKPLLKFVGQQKGKSEETNEIKARVLELAGMLDPHPKLMTKMLDNLVSYKTPLDKIFAYQELYNVFQKNLGAEMYCLALWGQDASILELVHASLKTYLEDEKETTSQMNPFVALWAFSFIIGKSSDLVVFTKKEHATIGELVNNILDVFFDFTQKLCESDFAGLMTHQGKRKSKKKTDSRNDDNIVLFASVMECFCKASITLHGKAFERNLKSNQLFMPPDLLELVKLLGQNKVFCTSTETFKARFVLLCALFDCINSSSVTWEDINSHLSEDVEPVRTMLGEFFPTKNEDAVSSPDPNVNELLAQRITAVIH